MEKLLLTKMYKSLKIPSAFGGFTNLSKLQEMFLEKKLRLSGCAGHDK